MFPAVTAAAGSGGRVPAVRSARRDGGGDRGQLVRAARGAEPGRAAGAAGARLRPHDSGAGEGAAVGREARGRRIRAGLALRRAFLAEPLLG